MKRLCTDLSVKTTACHAKSVHSTMRNEPRFSSGVPNTSKKSKSFDLLFLLVRKTGLEQVYLSIVKHPTIRNYHNIQLYSTSFSFSQKVCNSWLKYSFTTFLQLFVLPLYHSFSLLSISLWRETLYFSSTAPRNICVIDKPVLFNSSSNTGLYSIEIRTLGS